MTDDLRRQQIKALIEMGAKEFTGGDVSAFLQAATAPAAPPPTTAEDAARLSGYLDLYLDLKAAGLHRNKAFYAAWYAAPRHARQPATKKEVAALLGYGENGDQNFRKWERQPWWAEYQIDNIGMSILLGSLAEIDRATANAAREEAGHIGIQARRLYYEELERRERRRRPEPDVTIDVRFNDALRRIYGDSPADDLAGNP